METTLHRQLKEKFAGRNGQTEVKLGRFRIDVVRGKKLIEIQHSSLSAIRDKIRKLCEEHRVEVVKPLVTRKRLIKLAEKGGAIVDQRWSPKRGKPTDLFEELVYFTSAFPHPNLTLIVPSIEVEEVRFPGHGRRRRKREGDYQVEDLRIVEFGETLRFRKAEDWLKLAPGRFPKQFDTQVLADRMGVQRWEAQRAAYCLRKIGAIEQVGKKGNAILYSKVGKQKKKKVA